jgi:hypothetical protein
MRYWDIPCMKKGGGWVLTQGQPLVSLEEGPAREASGPGRVGPGRRRGGQGGFTKSDGNFKGDMHEGPGYPQCEERGRLGVDPRPWVKTPQGPKSQPGEGVRAGNARSK